MIKESIAILWTLVILLSLAGSAMAQENRVASGRNVQTAPSQPQGPTNPAELEAFLDDLLGRQMRDYHIAGAAISVVKDGRLFLPKATDTPTLRTASQSTLRRRSLPLAQSARCSPGRR